MKIEIGCSVEYCDNKSMAQILCNCFDEPAIGLFLPEGWSVDSRKQPSWVDVDFNCPEHTDRNRDVLEK